MEVRPGEAQHQGMLDGAVLHPEAAVAGMQVPDGVERKTWLCLLGRALMNQLGLDTF